MKIGSFISNNGCRKFSEITGYVSEKGRFLVLDKALETFATHFYTGKTDSIYRLMKEHLKKEYESLDFQYSWEAETYADDDAKKFERLAEHYKGYKKESLIQVTLYKNDSLTLEGKVQLVLSDEQENIHLLVMHPGICKRSIKGRSNQTKAAMDLHSLVAAYSALDRFEGRHIIVDNVYLTNKNDQMSNVSPFIKSDTAVTNLHSISYETEEGATDKEVLASYIDTVIEERKSCSCYGCSKAKLCNIKPLKLSEAFKALEMPKETSSYKLPSYSEMQLKAVMHDKGPLLVCAGPGSGKTATIIGRISHLINDLKVNPQFLLVVTFTKKAASELKERCLGIVEDETKLPMIATLNSFAYSILVENADLVGKKTILTPAKRQEIMRTITLAFPPIKGLNYSVLYGNNGLYAKLCQLVDAYQSETLEQFAYDNPKIDLNTFKDFVDTYNEILAANDFITFDDQISLANALFKEHPEVKTIYQNICKYVMVDEFQDTNKDQIEFLYNIVEKHKNIMVVGDDDQSIYAFRGASAKYMVNFADDFPEAKVVILDENYRSTQDLVDSAKNLIKNNVNRIDKNIISRRGVKGSLPRVIKRLDINSLDEAIDRLLSEGYKLGDMAVLSSKNNTLETIRDGSKHKSVLAKNYLRADGLFLFVLSVLKLHKNIDDNEAFYIYASLFNKKNVLKKEKGMSLFEALKNENEYPDLNDYKNEYEEDGIFGRELEILRDLFSLIDTFPEIKLFLDVCEGMINWKSSNSKKVLLDEAEQSGITEFDAFETYICNVFLFESETRVDIERDDEVLLITCHDAKGKEFPVTIIYDDITKVSEETRRLYYVALTRAKDICVILQQESGKETFINEIPHIDWNTRDNKLLSPA
ncbi:MAG: ATP-dependent helicase [Lachnospiraceae bacterium]|nr:ATP-dependent helicase [Lachnospiraceae bacterium]